MSEPQERRREPDLDPDPDPDPNAGQARALVLEGWRRLQRQCPLAAWASWQRALRVEPENEAARRAIETLERADELPAPARAVYRFQAPADAAQRERWDARLRARGLEDVETAADAFAALTGDHPADAEAWLNLALCRAWLGQNLAAVACLDRVVSLLAADDPRRAEDAWVLAEVLRQGAGAEAIADDFRYALVLDRRDDQPLPDDFLERWPGLVPAAMPADPITGAPQVKGGRVFEWLDRPPAAPDLDPDRADALPRVLAAVIDAPTLLRVSSPDPAGLARLDEPEFAAVGRALASARREKTPLPIAWADAALGTFRTPPGLTPSARATLARSVVEYYYENIWIHAPRNALGGLSPLEAARAARGGDVVARAKVAALVRYREQLGGRPTHAALYQGYPFDRLRRRLGLLNAGAGAHEPDDVACMNERELDDLDPAALDARRLAEAFRSAEALGSDARTVRFAAPLARLDASSFVGLDRASVVAPLVREALRLGDPEEALAWLASARAGASAAESRTFAVWSAEIHARTGEPEAAVRGYLDLLDQPGSDALLALDGAETLLDNGYPAHALPLLDEARSRALRSGDRATLQRAEWLLREGTGGGDVDVNEGATSGPS